MDRIRMRRAAGFTLIELLTVIAIIATMMSVLLPAVFKVQEYVKDQKSKEIVKRLDMACKSYSHDWEGLAPAAVSNPSSTGMTPDTISGCQNLRLALIGYEKNGNTLIKQYQGSAMDATKYVTGERRVFMKRYAKEEFLPHKSLLWTSSDWSGTEAGEIELFVDTEFEPVRPVLYYRKRGGSFHYSDNSVYMYSGNSSENSGEFDSLATKASNLKLDFILVHAGPDRKFFTSDDYDNVGR
jgi:prepilin-type N-terminal cleavage/methylation domain-containing protein